MKNPWKVNSIDAFSYLKCPECEFDSKAESYFKRHAIKNHPLSHVFFGNDTIDNYTSVTILKYNPNDIEKYLHENHEDLQITSTNLFEVNNAKEEIIPQDNNFTEIVITTPNSKFDTQTEVEEFCSDLEYSKQSAHDSVDNEIIVW